MRYLLRHQWYPHRWATVCSIHNYVCLSLCVSHMSNFLMDRLGRCLKVFVATVIPSSLDVASHFGLALFYRRKTPTTIAKTEFLRECSVEWTSDRSRVSPATRRNGDKLNGGNCSHAWSLATRWNGDNLNDDHCGHNGHRLKKRRQRVFKIPSWPNTFGLVITVLPMPL